MLIKLLVEGGNMKPGPALAQKIGPLGVNMGKIIQEVNNATKSFSGTKVPVAVDIDTKTKNFKIEVSSPPTAELLKKEIGAEKGTGASKKVKVGNISIEQVIKVAKTKSALEKELKSAVRTVVGSCVSLGILIESREAKEIEKDILNGVYDKEIKSGKTEPDKEKLAKLKEYFEAVKKKQEELLKLEEEEKAKAEAEKAAAAAAAGTPATAAPAAAAASAAKAAPAEKKEEKKPAK